MVSSLSANDARARAASATAFALAAALLVEDLEAVLLDLTGEAFTDLLGLSLSRFLLFNSFLIAFLYTVLPSCSTFLKFDSKIKSICYKVEKWKFQVKHLLQLG